MNDVRRTPWSPSRVAAAVLAVVAVALAVVGRFVSDDPIPLTAYALTAAIAVTFTAMAAVILAAQPRDPIGRLMAATGLSAAAVALAASWSDWLPLAWLTQWLWWPSLSLILLVLLLFPDGRLPSPRWRPLLVFIIATGLIATVSLAVAALDAPRDLVTSSQPTLTERARLFRLIAKLAVFATGGAVFGVLAALWARWRRADGMVRQQLACLLAAGVAFLLTIVLEVLGFDGAFMLAAVAVPVAMTVAILRYRLYDLDRVINRTLVWLVMTLLVVLGFVAFVALLRNILLGDRSSQASLLATGGIAVTFEPVRRRVQRGVNHLLYGDRDDPYKVLERLGDLLGQTLNPADVLPLLTEAIVQSLQVPYVAVELEDRDGPRLFAEHGDFDTDIQAFDMVTRGERVGRLLVATRSVGARFTPRECRLLQGVALHAAVAAEATRLIRELEDSRGRLIVAQDKERARLWRDLHDGVGSALTGMAMQIRAARKWVDAPHRVAEMLDALAADLRDCRAELRQLIDQLQPHALDRGLVEALRTECRRFTGPNLEVELDVTEDLSGLPVAIQAATHRIVAEALHNVVKHANAKTCSVTIGRRRSLTIDVVDDGVGIAAPRPDGVGLQSMRERASELGGDCVVTTVRPRGTAVRVRLPIAPTIKPSIEG